MLKAILCLIIIDIIVSTQDSQTNNPSGYSIGHISRDPPIDYDDYRMVNNTNYENNTIDYLLPEHQANMRSEDEEAILDMISGKSKEEEHDYPTETKSDKRRIKGSMSGYVVSFMALLILMFLVTLMGVFIVRDLNQTNQKIAALERTTLRSGSLRADHTSSGRTSDESSVRSV